MVVSELLAHHLRRRRRRYHYHRQRTTTATTATTTTHAIHGFKDELERGALAAAAEMELELAVERRKARDATIDDVLGADGYLFCAPENLASVSGEMKEFFDRHYYHAFASSEGRGGDHEEVSRLLGRPYGLAIAAGSDGTGAAKQVERICLGWRLRPVAETIVHRCVGPGRG